ncbi:MAG: carbamoyltransferase C-terminal domain-containing protein [Rhodospirillales bacterium]
MIVLSYYSSYRLSNHDPCVAIARGGELIYSFEEQKLSRVHSREAKFLPDRALLSALYTTQIDPSQIDVLCVVGPDKLTDPFGITARIEKFFGVKPGEVIACQHHAAHTALAVHGSGFDKGIYWTLDAGGEEPNTFGEVGLFEDGCLERHHAISKPSLPILYYLITGCCGFSDFEEGKVMGLAAYGKVRDELYRHMRALFEFDDFGHPVFTGSMNYVPPTLRWEKFSHDEFRPQKVVDYMDRTICPELDTVCRGYLPQDIAATGQQLVEDLAVEALRRMAASLSVRVEDVALVGGFFLNILVNKAIREEFNARVFTPPGCNDMGLAAGGALWASFKGASKPIVPSGRKRQQLSAYLGPDFDEAEIADLLPRFPLSYRRLDDEELPRAAAAEIANNQVVGWFQGRAECGARALGARSVLADPRNPESKARVNQLLKKRDWFMPYAPAILAEEAHRYVNKPCDAPFMTMAFDSLPGTAEQVPAAVHLDGTVRPQLVDAVRNPAFHALISAFNDLTGVGMVLNTSFNRHGVPIVATPRHAIEHLIEGVVDVLYVGPFEARLAAARPVTEEHFISEDVLKTVMALKHGYDFIARADTASAEKIWAQVPCDVRCFENKGEMNIQIEDVVFAIDNGVWDRIANHLAESGMAPGDT